MSSRDTFLHAVRLRLRSALGFGSVAALAIAAFALSAAALSPAPAPAWTAPAPTAAPGGTSVATRVVFLGDSYTQGVGASGPASRWTSLVSAARGWDEINLGRGGTGYVTTSDVNGCGLAFCPDYGQMLEAALQQKPGELIIAGGQNDFSAFVDDPDSVTAAIAAVYQQARATFPDIPIVAVGPSSPAGATDTVIALDSVVQEAAAAAGATYISLLNPPVIDPAMVLPDKAHVDDAGHRAIADRILSALP
jgi:lysophospholipase L1-like esterase